MGHFSVSRVSEIEEFMYKIDYNYTVNYDLTVILNSYHFRVKMTLGKVVSFISCEFAILVYC